MNKSLRRKLVVSLLGAATTMPLQAAAAPTETTLYSFTGGDDGYQPLAGLTKAGDLLYGTTFSGGAHGHGTVFSITPDGTFTTLYAFKGPPDASDPEASLLYHDGVLYGTSAGGGKADAGAIFTITPGGQENVVYSFKGGQADGAGPVGTLVELNNIFYGAAAGGGPGNPGNFGTVFSLDKSGKEKTLHFFNFQDGERPLAGLTVMNGTLYGTASDGGPYYPEGKGTAFSITPDGSFTLLHGFGGTASDVQYLTGPLLAVGDILYGVAQMGGPNGARGTRGGLYSVTPNGTEAVVGYFGTGGYYAVGNLVVKGRSFYGTAQGGGGKGAEGSIFRQSFQGGKETAYYPFEKPALPSPGLIRVGNTFYGVTRYGGGRGCNGSGCGTVFKLAP